MEAILVSVSGEIDELCSTCIKDIQTPAPPWMILTDLRQKQNDTPCRIPLVGVRSSLP